MAKHKKQRLSQTWWSWKESAEKRLLFLAHSRPTSNDALQTREAEKRKSTEEQLARVQQEANQLRAQVERLGSCQWPREFALFPPDTLPLQA
ncbi:uncharacterized protein N7515_002034 [Penicillium bovifimosum]|uniref:Uncharacterized protein n=1 Tax=Penicillium bovifimosum TaxID=126998 RepID=A0A9W9HAU0_9EURO|nr:uncharacterized protein N7515_002034 [Penicillium bovifimosum]KAJ5143247.1 hypothetical protein N7515_002034 [Penicillium bovifimosum]